MDNYDDVKTNDLALVAYLKMKGHTANTFEWDTGEGVCHWVFPSTAVSDTADFLEDRASVNPRDFTKAFGQAKREMYRAQDRARQSI